MSRLSFSSNRLSGSIPGSWLALPTNTLDVSSNRLSGSLPPPAGGSNPLLRELQLSNNSLSGPIDTSLDR